MKPGEIFCTRCGARNEIRRDLSSASQLKPCRACGLPIVDLITLLTELKLCAEEHRACPKCGHANCADDYCWACGHAM